MLAVLGAVTLALLAGTLVQDPPDGPVDSTGIFLPDDSQLAEATNTLRRLELSGTVSRLEATAAQRDLLRLNLRFHRFAPFAGRVWELRANLTAYDAWYVALAEALQWPLYTLDRKLSRAPGPRCEIVVPPASA